MCMRFPRRRRAGALSRADFPRCYVLLGYRQSVLNILAEDDPDSSNAHDISLERLPGG